MKPRKVRPCDLHSDCVMPCPRCAKANAENAKILREQTPWHEMPEEQSHEKRWTDPGPRKPLPASSRHREPTDAMIKEAARMFAHPLTLPPIKSEDHR
jgi:hypothetical protein